MYIITKFLMLSFLGCFLSGMLSVVLSMVTFMVDEFTETKIYDKVLRMCTTLMVGFGLITVFALAILIGVELFDIFN